MLLRTFTVAAALLLPLFAARADMATKYVRTGVTVARVMNVYPDRQRLRLQVSYPVTTLDQNAAAQVSLAQRQAAFAQLQMRAALARRDPNGVVQARQLLAQAQVQAVQASARLYRTNTVRRDFEVQAIDDVQVRISRPRPQFDDKGELKRKFSKAELKELKGDPKLPGYQAAFGDLSTEQVVRVTLVRKADAPARPKRGRTNKEEGGVPDGLADALPLVSRIEIVSEPPPR